MSKPKLALIPSGYKSGKVYSILPNDATGDFDFTRQSIGTRVRKDGLIEEAKTSGSITNELLYSEDFTQSNWFNSSSTDSISTVVSPDGASLSTLLTSTASNGALVDFNEWSTSVKTASIYVKKNTSSTFKIANLSSPTNEIVFNLDSGTVQSVGGNFSGQIISLPNGWFRCVGTHQAVSSQTLGFVIPTSGQSVYIWGAMLSEGALSDYIKTDGSQETKTVETFTDVPRLDWLNSNCPSLLLEPQRLNLQVYSEDFNNSAWSKSRATITANDTISPNGELTADKLTGDGTGTSYVFDGISLTNGVTYTISIFVKQITNISSFAINVFGGVGTAYFNLADKSTYTPTGDFTSAKIEDYGNGWLRCSGTLTLSSATGTKNIGYGLITFNGDQFYLFGAQIEQASYSSTYIKTEASTVTRLKDECINGGDSDLFDITEGTFFVDVTPFTYEAIERITLSNNNYNNRILISKANATQLQFIIVSNNVTVATFTTNITYNIRNKIAFTFKENEFKFYLNGSLVHTDTSGSVPTGLNDLSFKGIGSALYWNGKVHDTRVYDRVLTEAEAIELTTL